MYIDVNKSINDCIYYDIFSLLISRDVALFYINRLKRYENIFMVEETYHLSLITV